jgi:hypothetical protein
MNLIQRWLTGISGVVLIALFVVGTGSSQQRRQSPARPQAKPVASPTPAPTFDTLLATDCYKIYGEVRGVGQLIRSNTFTELLEPVMKLAGPPKELKSLVKWLNTHADEVMTSRMLVATWPTAREVPDVLVAIEFASAEDAAKFQPQLNSFLPKLLPPTKSSAPETSGDPAVATVPTPGVKPAVDEVKPNFYLQQAGSLVLITSSPLTLKKLKPARSKLLSDDPNFRIARNRFTSESVFVFIDVQGIEKEEETRRKEYAEISKKQEAEIEALAKAQEADPANEPKVADEENKADEMVLTESVVAVTESPADKEMTAALNQLVFSMWGGKSKWPESIGIAISIENESLDARALFISSPGEKSDAVPVLPQLIPGPPITPESPSILPIDTELFVVASLDLPQMYEVLSKPQPPGEYRETKGNVQTVKEITPESPFAAIERQLKIKIKDDVLPLLGSEIVLSLPVKELGIGPRPVRTAPVETATPGAENKTPPSPTPVIALSLKDKEGMKLLLPKLVDALGFKGASALAQTERREDTELVSYANQFAYAFIGNFVVLSTDARTVRHIVDSYLKRETLSGDSQFKNYTRWQPRQLQGQVYVSPALMESYRTWAEQPGTAMGDQAKEFVSRVGSMGQPITYSLSNEGLGSLHEIHVPKSLLMMLVAGVSSEVNPSPEVSNERSAIALIHSIASAQNTYKTKHSAGYASLDQLVEEFEWIKSMMETCEYRVEVIATSDKFEVSAVPLEYGKSGKTSFFMDQTGVLRGGDHGGGPATVADKPLY